MKRMKTLVVRVTALAALAVVAGALTTGTASAAGHRTSGAGSAISVNGSAYGHHEDNASETTVRTAGSGNTAVNAAGNNGYADQYANQPETDRGNHSRYVDRSEVDSHESSNSHNSSSYEDRYRP